MEYSKDETPTPHFGISIEDNYLVDDLLGKKIAKSSKYFPKFETTIEKHKSKSKSKSKGKSKSKSKEKIKSKSKERSNKKHKSSKDKKNKITSLSLPIKQQYENPLFILFQKKMQLRNDFDHKHSEKFLSEKELAFQEFEMDENADNLSE